MNEHLLFYTYCGNNNCRKQWYWYLIGLNILQGRMRKGRSFPTEKHSQVPRSVPRAELQLLNIPFLPPVT